MLRRLRNCSSPLYIGHRCHESDDLHAAVHFVAKGKLLRAAEHKEVAGPIHVDALRRIASGHFHSEAMG